MYVTVDPAPSNDKSAPRRGYTIRLFADNGDLLLSSGSQSYSSKAFATQIARGIFAGGAGIELRVSVVGHDGNLVRELTETLR